MAQRMEHLIELLFNLLKNLIIDRNQLTWASHKAESVAVMAMIEVLISSMTPITETHSLNLIIQD